MKLLANVLVSLVTSLSAVVGAYNFASLDLLGSVSYTKTPIYGTTITTILGSDTLKDSRTTINNNFSALNTDKFELSDWYATTSATQLVKVGTLTTGTWNATPITVPYGGTGSTTLSSNQVLLGNGTGNIKTVSGYGTANQLLTSNGAGNAPTWATYAVDQSLAYTWTGAHTFNTATTTLNAATTTISSNYVNFTGQEVAGINNEYLGSGVDGSATISSNTILTQDKYYQNLTINNGVTLKTGGYRIFATGTVSVLGTISNSGLNGSDAVTYTGGSGGASASSTTIGIGTSGGGGGGGDCGNGSTGGTSNGIWPAKGGSGGNGGGGGGGAGGRGGVAGTATAANNRVQSIYSSLSLLEFATSTTPMPLMAGTGGAGGAGAGNNGAGGIDPGCRGGGGGGAGGAGGVIQVIADKIIVSGSIIANGGNGGNGASNGGYTGGGGGGGGGGFIFLGYKTSYTNSGTVTAAAGTGGSGQASGSTGSAGTVISLKLK